MFKSFRPTLETLERREVFSTTADLVPVVQAASDPVSTEQISFNFADAARVATGDFNNNSQLDVVSQSFAGDGIGTLGRAASDGYFLLPYLEQDNLYKSLSGLSYETEAVESLVSTSDAPWADLDRQQIIAILIGLLQSSDQARESFVTDGTSNTIAFNSTLSALPTEDRQQIIAILIGLVQSPTKTADASLTSSIISSDEYFARLSSQTLPHADGLALI